MGPDWVPLAQKGLFCSRNTVSPWPQLLPRHTHPYWLYSYSILPALSLDGILHLAVEDHPYTAEQFNSFIDGLLYNMNEFPGPNSVIIMDNASIHKSWELRDMIERRYGVLPDEFPWLTKI